MGDVHSAILYYYWVIHMASPIATYNLERDKKVLGKEWLTTYGNWFSDETIIQQFIDVVTPILPTGEVDILYAASASGLLGERLVSSLGRGRLTIADMSQKHLDENDNPNTTKICVDLLEMDLGKQFDVIIMRSSLDYFASREFQVEVLKILKKHLKENGVFINQPAYISNPEERDRMSRAYNAVDKIGNRFFQSIDLESIYTEAGFKDFKKISAGTDMHITEQEHIERYALAVEDILKIQAILKVDGDNVKLTENGYELMFEFPIFIAKSAILTA